VAPRDDTRWPVGHKVTRSVTSVVIAAGRCARGIGGAGGLRRQRRFPTKSLT